MFALLWTLFFVLYNICKSFPDVTILNSPPYLPRSTKVAIKMSRGSKNKEPVDTKRDESESSSLSSEEGGDSDVSDDEGREETPDLYRNSALGMYGGVSPK